MKFTNKYNLPEPVVNALKYSSYYNPGHISATQLIKPPRIVQLEKRYAELLEEDVSDGIWRLLGSAAHYALEHAEAKNALQEERLCIDVFGWRMCGQGDLWHEPGILSDYKVTSVWAIILGDKPDWERQLNIYAHLFSAHGFPVKKLNIYAIIRDWRKGESLRGGDYPPCGFVTVDVPLWSGHKQIEYIEDRVILHQSAESTPDDGLPYCTPKERWERPTTYAVVKKGNKRATRVLNTEVAAIKVLESETDRTGKPHAIVVRKGQSIRCDSYCLVRDYCNQYRDMVKED